MEEDCAEGRAGAGDASGACRMEEDCAEGGVGAGDAVEGDGRLADGVAAGWSTSGGGR